MNICQDYLAYSKKTKLLGGVNQSSDHVGTVIAMANKLKANRPNAKIFTEYRLKIGEEWIIPDILVRENGRTECWEIFHSSKTSEKKIRLAKEANISLFEIDKTGRISQLVEAKPLCFSGGNKQFCCSDLNVCKDGSYIAVSADGTTMAYFVPANFNTDSIKLRKTDMIFQYIKKPSECDRFDSFENYKPL